ncbi:MAG: FAD-dependent oxidoreductase [Limisphaerales bacterium]
MNMLLQMRSSLLRAVVLALALTLTHPGHSAAANDPALVAPAINTAPGPNYADSTRIFQGIPGIERAANGRLWALWYAGGPGEPGEGPGNYVVLVTSGDNGRTWSGPKLVIDPPGPVRAYDPALWHAPDGRLWLFWAQSYQWWDGRSGVWATVSENSGDEAPRWSAPRRLCNGIMMNKPTVLSTGEWLLPASVWERAADARTDAAFRHDLASENAANVHVSRDKGATWSLLGQARVPRRVFDEHMVVERKDGSLWMLVRAAYGIGESESADRGKTWSTGRESTLPNVNSRFFIRRLSSGRLLLVAHEPPDKKTRSHLTARLSDDDGKTWRGGLLLDERAGVSYPDGVQAPDGTIYLIYDYQRTGDKQILMATFNEADVTAGKWTSSQARQRVVVNQATGKSAPATKPKAPAKTSASAPRTAAHSSTDVVVYGATPAGVCAAIGAAREGASVALVEPTAHVGGVNSGGLSFSDSNQMVRAALRGLFEEFHLRMEADYRQRGVKLPYDVSEKDAKPWTYEPHVAMRVMLAMLKEAGVQIHTEQMLVRADKAGTRLTGIATAKGGTFLAKTFVDATYEGDLMAAAKVSWVIGREGRKEFGESLSGKQYPKPPMKISGLDANGNLLPLLTAKNAGVDEDGDRNVMTYSFRLCVTTNAANRVPFPEPAHYDPARFEAVRRYFAQEKKPVLLWDLYPLPGNKADANNGIGKQFSMGIIGGGNAWCESGPAERARIWEAHRQYTLEMYRFLTTDTAVPEALRNTLARYGLCQDEFAAYGHWSPQLYVREGRRMRGAYVLTQSDILTNSAKADSIAVASFPIDSHDCQRIARGTDEVINEGTIFPFRLNPAQRAGPAYQVPYRAITPKAAECANLLVPVALSATHVAYSSVRVEPAWMVIGHSAGVAAALAARGGADVQRLDYAQLRGRLLAQKQVVDLNPATSRPALDADWDKQAAADAKQDRSSIPYDGKTPNKLVCDTTLRQLPDGSWALFMLAGDDFEPSPKNYVGLTRSRDEGRTWTPLEPVDIGFPREGRTSGQGPTELLVRGGRSTLFFSTHSQTWGRDWQSWFMHSDDSCRTWSRPEPVPGRLGKFTFIRNHIVARDGRILIPFQHYVGPPPGTPPPAPEEKPWHKTLFHYVSNPRNGVLVSSDGGRTWSEHGNVRLTTDDRYHGWAENNIAELSDGRIAMIIRADRLGGVLYYAESKDGGKTWPEFAVKTDIPNPGSKATLYPLGGDTVAMLHNPNPKHRSPMALWISFDGLKTWPYRRVLVPESCDGPRGAMNYPDGFVSADRQWLHFAFDDNRHRAVHYSAKLPPLKP